MDIRLSVFPTSSYPKLIAYTNEYKIRDSISNQFAILINNFSEYSGSDYPYCIRIGNRTRFMTYTKGSALEKLLNYYSHRETEGTIYED